MHMKKPYPNHSEQMSADLKLDFELVDLWWSLMSHKPYYYLVRIPNLVLELVERSADYLTAMSSGP